MTEWCFHRILAAKSHRRIQHGHIRLNGVGVSTNLHYKCDVSQIDECIEMIGLKLARDCVPATMWMFLCGHSRHMYVCRVVNKTMTEWYPQYSNWLDLSMAEKLSKKYDIVANIVITTAFKQKQGGHLSTKL